jgi:hypothetical protein
MGAGTTANSKQTDRPGAARRSFGLMIAVYVRILAAANSCEKTDISYSAIISFACGLMLVKSVHTA